MPRADPSAARSRRETSWACLERRGVLDRLERRTAGIAVRFERARLGVRYTKGHLDVRQAGGKNPGAAVEATAVERLDEHLHVSRVEEPEVAGVARQRDRCPHARGGQGPPLRGHLKCPPFRHNVVVASATQGLVWRPK